MDNIIELKETSNNEWRAKYQGNYGIYTIKILLDKKGKIKKFSCSCPSDNRPCKHIGYVEKAIAEYKEENKNEKSENTLTVTEILKKISFNELRSFIVKQCKYNEELTNALVVEFSHKFRKNNENPYSKLIKKTFQNFRISEDEYYSEYGCAIEPFDEWLDKAEKCLKSEKNDDAVLICKACLEEFANWLKKTNIEIEIFEGDKSRPFEVLHKIIEKTGVLNNDLYEYCKSEMNKPIYKKAFMLDDFNDLLIVLTPKDKQDEFLTIQDNLLKMISDKSSYEAQKILLRKIDFYRKTNQHQKAEEIVETNLQIEDFRRQTVEKYIAQKKYAEAKRLIADFLKHSPSNYREDWDELILEIAQKENNITVIQETAYKFIKNNFDKKYYEIYKSAFTQEEWKTAFEKLAEHYNTGKNFYAHPAADLFAAENLPERLLAYVEKHCSLDVIEKYHTKFSKQFPEKTLEMYRKILDKYAKDNLGRDHYENIRKHLNNMKQIDKGEAVVAGMVSNYRQIYKNRPAMMEVLKNV